MRFSLAFFFFFFLEVTPEEVLKNTSGIFAANQMAAHQIRLNRCSPRLTAQKE